MLRERIKQVADEFPEDVDVDAFLERIYLLQDIDVAEKQIAEGNVFTHEEAIQQLKPWLE
jgi:predicted transcriptional regulator